MKRLGFAILGLMILMPPVVAQNTRVVTSCTGINMNWAVNDLGRPLMVDSTGVLCTNAARGGSVSIDQTTPGTTNGVVINNPTSTGIPGAPATDQVLSTQAVNNTATANITTQNLNPTSNVPTAGSTVGPISPLGNACTLQITGTFSGALSLQQTNDNINWITLLGSNVFTKADTYAQTATATSVTQTIYALKYTPGTSQIRVTALSAQTGTAVTTINCTPDLNPPLTNVAGLVADGSTASGAPVQAGGVVATTASTALAAGVMSRLKMTSGRQIVEKPFAEGESDWTTGAAPITVTASNQALVAAGAAGIRNYLTWFTIDCGATWTANTLQFQNGTTVVMERDIPAGAGVYNSPYIVNPLKTSAATALNVKATGAVTGACKINAGGFLAP